MATPALAAARVVESPARAIRAGAISREAPPAQAALVVAIVVVCAILVTMSWWWSCRILPFAASRGRLPRRACGSSRGIMTATTIREALLRISISLGPRAKKLLSLTVKRVHVVDLA